MFGTALGIKVHQSGVRMDFLTFELCLWLSVGLSFYRKFSENRKRICCI